MALRLDEIRIYPIKSLPGIRVRHARVLQKGLEFDRRFMLIDRDNRFMTQRTLPQLSQYELSIAEGTLTIRSKRMPAADTISLDLTGSSIQGTPLSAEVWDDTVTVTEANPLLSSWFTLTSGMECKLVWFPEENPRAVDPDYAPSDQHVSLADGYPMLIIGTATLADLNTRLAQRVTMDRFRPNLIFSGGEPYQEDDFREFSIGKNIFAGVKPCSRCNLITIDPETGEAGAEPLRTLSGYRKRNNKVYFGQNVIALHHDHLHEGDEILLTRLSAILLLSASCTVTDKPLPVFGNRYYNGTDTVYHTIAPFALLDQDSTLVTNETVDGKVYVADFFFTTCRTICPKMKKQMTRVYEATAEMPDFVILSHTIDPEHDNVEYLHGYAGRLGAKAERWHFLTGNRDSIFHLAQTSYFATAMEDKAEPDGYIHSGAFLLIDRKGRIRGKYDGTLEDETNRLIADIKRLRREGER